MHHKIWILQIFSSFSQVLDKIWLFYPKIANFGLTQTGIIAFKSILKKV